MKKVLINLFICLMVIFTFSSCVTSALGQEVVLTTEDASVVVNLGTPYYLDGSIYYYIYNNRYYYPRYIDGRVYYHSYARPLPHHYHMHGNTLHYPHRGHTDAYRRYPSQNTLYRMNRGTVGNYNRGTHNPVPRSGGHMSVPRGRR